MSYIVSVIGRPNVGKSTLFNRLTQTKKAIIEDIAGVTRDRLYEKVEYKDKFFNLIDTGGITLEEGDFNKDIKVQAEIAIDESDLILFIVDGKSMITKEDEQVAQILRQSKKEVVLVINKVDNSKVKDNIYDFYTLGFETLIPISAEHGVGTFDILEHIYPKIPLELEEEDDTINFSLIGRPNVGKSSLFNAIIGEDRSIVSDVEGTTRDSIDTEFTYEDNKFKIIDTAGIRKRGKVYESIEKYSVLRALKSIEKSDIILWVIDSDFGLVEQDKRVLGYALDLRKPIVVLVNKWDLIKKESNTQAKHEQELKAKMPFIKDSHFIYTSAINNKGIKHIIPSIVDLYDKYTKEFSTSQVNNVLNDAVMAKVPPSYKGKPIKFYYATQIGSKPPRFLFFVNNKEIIHFTYKRYLENYFKNAFGLEGIKLKFQFKNRDESDEF
ncbi:MAG: ribosome biogenesis GTPase Der [Mycoplasmatales bacterium]